MNARCLVASPVLNPETIELRCLTCELASGQTPTSDSLPPPLTEYYGRTIAQTMHYAGAPWLVRESRQREEDCQEMLRQLQLDVGQQVCDMGCGNGFHDNLPESE